jgi:Cu(I)/Ag(I) efflux system membrane fusion protein
MTTLAWATSIPARQDEGAQSEGEREVAYWVAPMDPDYRRDEPGKSPMGMDLIPVYVDEITEAGQVRVSNPIQQQMNLRTATARRDRLWRRIDTVGRVQPDESAIHHLHPRVEGWIRHVDVTSVGERIEAGQRLFTLYSPRLVNAQDEFLQALRRGEDVLIESAAERLRTLGVQPEFIDALRSRRTAVENVPWFARHDGIVLELGARHGMYVEPGDMILETVSLDRVWVIADVFARHSDWLASGHPAEIRTAYRPGTTFESRIDYVYPLLDEATRTVRVRLPVDNDQGQLKPGMWADVRIFAGPVDDQLIVPREAVIRTGRSERVVLRIDDERFAVRDVVTGMESGDYVAIVEGLEAGDTVVTSGQFLLDSEASQNAGEQRLGGHHDH